MFLIMKNKKGGWLFMFGVSVKSKIEESETKYRSFINVFLIRRKRVDCLFANNK